LVSLTIVKLFRFSISANTESYDNVMLMIGRHWWGSGCTIDECHVIEQVLCWSCTQCTGRLAAACLVWDELVICRYKSVGKLSSGHQAPIMKLAVDDTDTADGNICVVTGAKDHYVKVW